MSGTIAAPDGAGLGWISRILNGDGAWRLRGRLPYLLGFAMLFDSWDSIVIAYTLPSIIAEWKLSALDAGWLISAGYGGQFVGAIGFGALAERWGRIPAIRLMVLLMGVLALACAVAGSYDQLVAIRLLQGFAIGGGLPVATCYINEIAPTKTRGHFFGTFQFMAISGFGIAGVAGSIMVPMFGWRIMFALGAVPLFVLPFFYAVPESPRWLAGRGRPADAAAALARLGSAPFTPPPVSAESERPMARVPVRDLIAPGVRGKSAVVGLLWFFTSLVSFGLSTWIPSLYVGSFHIPIADALRYTTISAISVFFLPILLRQSIDRIGRRPPVILGTSVGGVALLVLAFVPIGATALVVTLSIVGSIGVAIGSMVLWPYSAEVFDTRIRSVALGTFSSMARAASMLTPLVVGGLLDLTGSVRPIFLIFAGCSLFVAILWIGFTRETAGREMDG